MEDSFWFDYTSTDGRTMSVESSSAVDIWAWYKDRPVKWSTLSQVDQDAIRDRVEEHYFMKDAQKGWSER